MEKEKKEDENKDSSPIKTHSIILLVVDFLLHGFFNPFYRYCSIYYIFL